VGTRSAFPWQANLQLIKEKFIPVALDIVVMDARQDAEGAFFRKVNDGRFTWASGRVHAMTADGKFLCGHKKGDYHRDCDPSCALAEWNKLPEGQRKPGAVQVPDMGEADPKVLTPPPGALIVKVYQARLDRDTKGELVRCKALFGDSAYAYEPGRDFLWLTEAQWESLLPTDARKGDRHSAPAQLASRIARHTLTDGSEANPVRWKPADLRCLDFALTVEEASAAGLRLRLEGSVQLAEAKTEDVDRPAGSYDPRLREEAHPDPKAAPRYDARLLGYLDYDRKQERFTRFDVVAVGEYVGRALNPYRAEDGNNYYVTRPYALGVALELSPPSAVVPPSNYGRQ
jgi:hypothetical protein